MIKSFFTLTFIFIRLISWGLAVRICYVFFTTNVTAVSFVPIQVPSAWVHFLPWWSVLVKVSLLLGVVLIFWALTLDYRRWVNPKVLITLYQRCWLGVSYIFSALVLRYFVLIFQDTATKHNNFLEAYQQELTKLSSGSPEHLAAVIANNTVQLNELLTPQYIGLRPSADLCCLAREMAHQHYHTYLLEQKALMLIALEKAQLSLAHQQSVFTQNGLTNLVGNSVNWLVSHPYQVLGAVLLVAGGLALAFWLQSPSQETVLDDAVDKASEIAKNTADIAELGRKVVKNTADIAELGHEAVKKTTDIATLSHETMLHTSQMKKVICENRESSIEFFVSFDTELQNVNNCVAVLADLPIYEHLPPNTPQLVVENVLGDLPRVVNSATVSIDGLTILAKHITTVLNGAVTKAAEQELVIAGLKAELAQLAARVAELASTTL